MKKKSLKSLLTVAITASLLAGCGSANWAGIMNESAAVAPMTAPKAAGAAFGSAPMEPGEALYDAGYGEYETAETAEEAGLDQSAQELSGDSQAGRKLITTMNLSAETERFDELMGKLEGQIKSLGGYVENSEQWNGSPDYYGERVRNRNASLTVRIPAERLDRFVAIMEEGSNITDKSRSVEDVTLAYVDLESHKRALLTAQDRLLNLLEKAETVEDLITIEDKLTDIRYQLESMESKLRTYDNQINYSTVYLHIQEVNRLTPAEQLTTWGRIQSGFAESLYDVGVGVRDFFVGLAINIPYIVLWLVILAIVLPLALWIARFVKNKDKRIKKRECANDGSKQKIGFCRLNRQAKRGKVDVNEHADRHEGRDHVEEAADDEKQNPDGLQ